MALVVHHLNCGRMRPHGGRLVFGNTSHRHLVCHCLLVECGDDLVLIDAGFGLDDIASPRKRLGGEFLAVTRPELDAKHTAIAQIKARGLDPNAVKHIILTHMDLDHAGGLSDFPAATVHVMRTEFERAQARPTRLDKGRYRPDQWAHGPTWEKHDVAGERWNGFEAVRDLPGLPPEILLVPATGHSAGHACIGLQTASGWLLHCGDAYFHRDEVNPTHPYCTPGLRAFQWIAAYERQARLHNRDRLRDLNGAADDVRLFSAHDPVEFEGFSP